MSIILDGTTGITTPGLTNTGTETLVNLTTTGNTILGDASTDTLNVGNGGLVKDASGNVGIGVTPSAWASGWKPLQMGSWGAWVGGRDSFSQLWTGANNYYNGTNWIYKATDYATQYYQADGAHIWRTAASGTAGNAITWTQAMTLDASGNLGLGVTTVLGRAQFNVSDTSTTILNNPALYLSNTGTATTNQRVDLGFRWQDGTYNGSSAISAIRESGTNRLTAFAFCPSDSSGNPVERARIDSLGNFGIGTTGPNKTGFTSPVLSITNGTSGIVELIGTQTADGTIGQVAFYNTSSSVRIAQILGVRSGANNSGAITFQTNNAGTLGEAARIDSSGNLLVGMTSSSGMYSSLKSVGAYYGFGIAKNMTDLSGRRNWSIDTEVLTVGDFAVLGSSTNTGTANTVRFQITSAGSCYNNTGTYGTISDVKLKENVVDATPKLADLMQVRIVNYNKIGQTQKEIGVIAQELELIFPNMVDTADDLVDGEPTGTTTKSVKYSVFVPMLIKALQEQQTIIQSLTDRITVLENK